MAKKKKVEGAPEAPDDQVVDPITEEDSPASVDTVLETPPLVLDREKHIKVDLHANGGYQVMAAPRGWYFDRRISLIQKGVSGNVESGFTPVQIVVNLEHVDDDADGVWCYRMM